MKSFLGKWSFSSSLEERLKEFTTSTTYTFSLRPTVTNCTESSFVHEEVNDEKHIDPELEVDIEVVEENSSVGNSIKTHDSSFCLTNNEPSTEFLSLLHEGPISAEELSNISCDHLPSVLEKASDTVIKNFCESVCLYPTVSLKLIQILCENCFLPKILDILNNLSRALLNSMKMVFETYPLECCNHVLLPILKEPKLSCKLDPVLSNLDMKSKVVILKSLLESSFHVIEEHQVSLFQALISASLDINTSELLIDLLVASGGNLCKSTKYGKLLVYVTKQVGSSLQTRAREKLLSVIESHKSFQKTLAVKAFQSLEGN